MDRLDAMRLFMRVLETGSFSAVAREANMACWQHPCGDLR